MVFSKTPPASCPSCAHPGAMRCGFEPGRAAVPGPDSPVLCELCWFQAYRNCLTKLPVHTSWPAGIVAIATQVALREIFQLKRDVADLQRTVARAHPAAMSAFVPEPPAPDDLGRCDCTTHPPGCSVGTYFAASGGHKPFRLVRCLGNGKWLADDGSEFGAVWAESHFRKSKLDVPSWKEGDCAAICDDEWKLPASQVHLTGRLCLLLRRHVGGDWWVQTGRGVCAIIHERHLAPVFTLSAPTTTPPPPPQ